MITTLESLLKLEKNLSKDEFVNHLIIVYDVTIVKKKLHIKRVKTYQFNKIIM